MTWGFNFVRSVQIRGSPSFLAVTTRGWHHSVTSSSPTSPTTFILTMSHSAFCVGSHQATGICLGAGKLKGSAPSLRLMTSGGQSIGFRTVLSVENTSLNSTSSLSRICEICSTDGLSGRDPRIPPGQIRCDTDHALTGESASLSGQHSAARPFSRISFLHSALE